MEQYKGQHDGQQNSQQPARENIGNYPVAPGDMQAPVTLLPTVLSRLGLSNVHTGAGVMNYAPTDLHSSHWQVRLAAVHMLSKMESQAPLEPLLAALQDEDASIRAAAIRGLSALGERVPVERLIEALHDPDWHVRETAVLMLGKLLSGQAMSGQAQEQSISGRPPAPSLPLVSSAVFDEVLHDADSTVRNAAQLVLQWTRQRGLNESSTTLSSTSRPVSQVPDAPGIRPDARMQPQQMQLEQQPQSTQPTQSAQSMSIPFQSSVFPSQKNVYMKQRQHGNAPGGNMQERQERRQQPSMQEPEYEYYAYQGDDRARQWEKVTSYAPRKNYRPFWIGGIAGGIIFLIVAANVLIWGYTTHNAMVKQLDFAKPTMMPKPIPTSSLSDQALYIYRNHLATVNAVAWSPDGSRIASASDDTTVQVWDALTGNHPLIFGGHTAPVDTVAWSPDGKRIASGSTDGTIEVRNSINGTILFIDHFAAAADIQHIGALQAFSGGGNPGVYTLMWSPDGTRIAAAMGSDLVKEFDARTGNTLFTYHSLAGEITAMAWSPDGRYIATVGNLNTITLWDETNGNTASIYPVDNHGWAFSLAWSPEGKRIAIGYLDGSVRIWTPATNSIVSLNGHSQNVYALAWSPDGSRLATASIDDTVQIVNTTSGEEIYTYTGHTNELRTVAWSPNGKLIASGSSDNTVQVWAVPQ